MPSTVLPETAKPCHRRKSSSLAWLGLAWPRTTSDDQEARSRPVRAAGDCGPADRRLVIRGLPRDPQHHLAGADKMGRRTNDRYRLRPVISDSSLKPEPRRNHLLQSMGLNSFRLPSGPRRRFSDHYVAGSSWYSPDELPDLRFTRTAVAAWDDGSQMKAFRPTHPNPRHDLLVLQ
jgi:hypothetical protein